MDKYYKKLSSFLTENQSISKEDEELYEYATKIVIHGIINIVSIISIGIIFGMIQECFCFFITFFILRKFTGGLHVKKYVFCLISSIVIIVCSLCSITFFEKSSYNIVFLILVITSVMMICTFSPLENQNKELSNKEKKVYKSISILLSLLFLSIVFFFLFRHNMIFYSFGMGLIVVSICLLLGKQSRFFEKIFD